MTLERMTALLRRMGIDPNLGERHAVSSTIAKVADELEATMSVLREGVSTAERVVARWESGDLAEAVNDLREWAKDARGYVK